MGILRRPPGQERSPRGTAFLTAGLINEYLMLSPCSLVWLNYIRAQLKPCSGCPSELGGLNEGSNLLPTQNDVIRTWRPIGTQRGCSCNPVHKVPWSSTFMFELHVLTQNRSLHRRHSLQKERVMLWIKDSHFAMITVSYYFFCRIWTLLLFVREFPFPRRYKGAKDIC